MNSHIKKIFIILSVSLFFSLFESVIVFAGGEVPVPECSPSGGTCYIGPTFCCSGLACQNNVCTHCGDKNEPCCSPDTCNSNLVCQNNVCTTLRLMKIWIKEPQTRTQEYCSSFTSDSCNADSGCGWSYASCCEVILDYSGSFSMSCPGVCGGLSESQCTGYCVPNYACIPTNKMLVSGDVMDDCTASGDMKNCFSYYYYCDVYGWYQGQVQDIDSGTYSPWTNLWYCGPPPQPVSSSSLSVSSSGERNCTVTASLTALNYDGKSWQIKDGGDVKCSGTVSGTSYSYTCQNWTVGVGTYTYSLYVDGTMSDSDTVNCPVSDTCDYNRKCEGIENCKNCPDCGCTINQTCSSDGTCKNIPIPPSCNHDGICQQGEGCTCSDCIGKKNSCGDGDLVCLITTDPSTNATCQCPSDKPYWCIDHCDISSNCTCGNGIVDQGENCKNCPNDAGCLSELRCCQDGICRSDCNGPGCDLNQICDRNETYYETCDCSDCLYLQDRCILGDICTADGKCGCNPISDGICTRDISCIASDPDCKCNNNGICESGEIQDGCPNDCSTKVILFPSRLYPNEKINVTVYFNDSRYVTGENAKVVLYIDNVPWTGCAVHDSKWKDDLNWDGSTNWIANNVMGKMQVTASSSVKITSVNNYARIDFDCMVPSDLSQGTHTLKAVPYIYSKEIELGSSEAQFNVPDNSLMLVKFILFSIKLIF